MNAKAVGRRTKNAGRLGMCKFISRSSSVAEQQPQPSSSNYHLCENYNFMKNFSVQSSGCIIKPLHFGEWMCMAGEMKASALCVCWRGEVQ